MSAPIRCLVLQLARLGDTLQSLMALRAAKELYPELEIHFVARERFASAARRVGWIEKVITLPTDELLGPVVAGEKKDTQALRELARWTRPLVQQRWDIVANWTYSEASSYLAGILPARVKLGFSRSKDGQHSAADGWSQYIQGIIQGGVPQNIHLTDILTTQLLTALQIHHGEPRDPGDASVSSKSFFSCELMESGSAFENVLQSGWSLRDSTKKWIAIQLGASRREKTWSPRSWAQLAMRILKRHPECRFALLGGREDVAHARSFLSLLQSEGYGESLVLNLTGQTDFDLWSAVIGSCQWVFTGDTAAVHLASILGTRVLNVSVGPVRLTETGPYGNGHYVIAPARRCPACAGDAAAVHSCRDDVTPEAVYGAWSYASTEWTHRRQLSLAEHLARTSGGMDLDGVNIYRSRIRPTEDGGGVLYEPVLNRALDIQAWTGAVLEHVARAWYCGWTPEVGTEMPRQAIDPELVRRLRELDQGVEALLLICRQATRVGRQLEERSRQLKSGKLMSLRDRADLQGLSEKLQKLDSLIERLGRTHPSLLGFAQMSKVLMHNLPGNGIAELGQQAALAYKQLEDGATLLRAWVGHGLQAARPQAVTKPDGMREAPRPLHPVS